MPLYHADIYIPSHLNLPRGPWALYYTEHAKRAAKSDRYGTITLMPYLLLSKCELIEVETDGEKVIKLLYRTQYDAKLDVCFAVIPENGFFRVKTLWLNQRSDKHRTLNRSKYDAK